MPDINLALSNLQNLLRTRPFDYYALYGFVPPHIAVQSGGVGILAGRGYGAGAFGLDPATEARLEEERAKFGGDIDRLQQQNPIPTTPAASAPPPMAPGYTGPSAFDKLAGLLPAGFEQSALPASFADPFVSSSLGTAKGSAQDFISRMLARRTTTPQGAEAAGASLGTQEPGVRERLANIANLKLEEERAKVRGIAGEGYAAAQAPGETGQFFDPTPYQQRVQSEIGQFTAGFPAAYGQAAEGVGFDTSGFLGAAGAVTGPQNVQYDPYAFEGGKVPKGEEEALTEPTAKKRTTAVF